MARLIDLDELLKFPIRIDHYDKENGNEHFVYGVESVLEYAEHLPAADAVEVPCKMGDIVWGIKTYNRGHRAKQGKVVQMYFGEDMRLCICVKNVCRGEWGKNVFATKEEAEAAIERRTDNDV